MKQIHFNYYAATQFRSDLEEAIEDIQKAKSYYFQLFSAVLDFTVLENVTSILRELFPHSVCIANSTAGNIINSDETGTVTVIANLFEYETSRFDVQQYEFDTMAMEDIAAEIRRAASERPWTKAIEIYYTVPKISTSFICDNLADLDVNVKVFGGIVCSSDITSTASFIYSTAGGTSGNGLICLFLGGEDLYVDSIKISGWKSIGRTFRVTRSEGSLLKELDGIPAYDIYKRYLNIQNDENFFINALDFPIMYEHNNTTIVRASASSNDDGSINMSANIDEGSIVRLSYGEPQTIVDSIREKGETIKEFQPDVMHIFSCAARKAFWATYAPTYELRPLKSICNSSGFFSHGEFLREKGLLNQHNLTLVIASIREGEKQADSTPHTLREAEKINTKLPLATRMATFIRETSYELEQINSRLEVMNEQLQGFATTDALTGLDNRLAFNDMLAAIETESNLKDNWNMYMFDVNGLKYINDTFGHFAGDELIKSAAFVITKTFGRNGYCYRIGGDEFVVLIQATYAQLREYDKQMEKIMEEHNKSAMYHLSIAVGKSRLVDDNTKRKSISDWKMEADLSMYRNKAASHRQQRTVKDENLKELISCLITIEEAKDSYTAYHSDRVCSLSGMLARKMGLTEETISMISDAAALHDIGKVGISDAVLLKPGKLTADEFDQIKEHSMIGAKILMKSNYMQEFVQIVMHHHERYDGKGYPDGISGMEIPLGSRIIAIADSIDAMTSRRIYRDALPLSVCRAEIEKNIGKMYDPAIATIALENWEDIEQIVMANPKHLFKK